MIKSSIFFSVLACSTVFSHYHEPGFEISYDGKIHLNLHHQTSIVSVNNHVLLLHAFVSPHSHTKHHSEWGIGYRNVYDTWSFGFNCVHSGSNVHGPFNHQFSPGIEINIGHFDFNLNFYLPVNENFIQKSSTLNFHQVTELSISYRPSKKYEFSLSPFYNHNIKKGGCVAAASAYVFDNWQISISPFCEAIKTKGVKFSMAYHFGGAKKVENRILKKSHRFFYHSSQKEKEKLYTPILEATTIPEPMVLAPTLSPPSELIIPQEPLETPNQTSREEQTNDLPVETLVYNPVEPEQDVSPPETAAPPPELTDSEYSSWVKYLFFWRRIDWRLPSISRKS